VLLHCHHRFFTLDFAQHRAIIAGVSFFAIIFALLIEQVRPLLLDSQAHRAAFAWARSCARTLDAGRSHHGWLVWSAAVLLPALVAFAVDAVLIHSLGWTGSVLAFAWHVLILYATLGFRQFSHHFTAIRDALHAGDTLKATRLLARWKRVDDSQIAPDQLLRILMAHSVVAAHRHVFAVLGWYAVLAALGLGPAGAVLYRMSEFAARYFNKTSRDDLYSSVYHSLEAGTQRPAGEQLSSPSSQHAAQTAWQWIDYLPARATAMAFAVVGNFEEVVEGWRNRGSEVLPEDVSDNDGLIQMAMGASLNAKSELQPAHLASMVGLVWRAVVLWLLLIALLTLAKLLG
jgi:adenosylcobinamide-phosphate synthase